MNVFINYICIYIYINILIYVHYIGARHTWYNFFPRPHGISRAPHFGDHWLRKQNMKRNKENFVFNGFISEERETLGRTAEE